MLRNIFLKSIQDSAKIFISVFVLFFFTCLMVMYVVSELPMEEFQRIVDLLPKALIATFSGPEGINLTTPEGVLNTDMFTVFMPIISIGSSIYFGYESIAKEEENRTLDLILSSGISRPSFLIQKLLSLSVKSMIIVSTIIVSISITGMIFDLNILMKNVFAICAQLFLVSVTFGFISVFISVLSSKSSIIYGVTSGMAILSYLIYSLEPFLKKFSFIKYFSFFYYYKGGDPLINGFHSWHWAVFISTNIIIFLFTMYYWIKKDLNS